MYGDDSDSGIKYQIKLKIRLLEKDNSEEDHTLALSQATMYCVMDYMNQHTFATTTARMLSEISYTVAMTVV